MSDTKLRDLERRWKETGTVEDEAAYLRERVRVGELSSDTLKLAAYCGHNGAVAASGVSVGPPVQSIDRGHTDQRNAEQSVVVWLRGLRALGQVPWITAIAASLAPIVAAAGERRVRVEISSRLDRALSLLEKPHPFIELSPLPDWRDRWWGHDSDLQPVAQAATQLCAEAVGPWRGLGDEPLPPVGSVSPESVLEAVQTIGGALASIGSDGLIHVHEIGLRASGPGVFWAIWGRKPVERVLATTRLVEPVFKAWNRVVGSPQVNDGRAAITAFALGSLTCPRRSST